LDFLCPSLLWQPGQQQKAPGNLIGGSFASGNYTFPYVKFFLILQRLFELRVSGVIALPTRPDQSHLGRWGNSIFVGTFEEGTKQMG
jgi:hypothetical protein